MEKERILITVKTYPTLSRKYGETVCTAGVREDGTWVRLYPIPFRRLDKDERYKKFDWIECRLSRNSSDPRPETFRPLDFEELHAVAHMGTANKWQARRELLLKTARVHTRLDQLIEGAKANQMSLAVFKPSRILDFTWEPEDREWDPDKLRQMRDRSRQQDLFEDNSWQSTFQVVRKLPYSFSYKFEDAAGKESELMVLDWEVGALYWKCLMSCDGDERQAIAKVKEKYLGEFLKTDLHFFLGTTQEWHFKAPNPWLIVGVFQIPHDRQQDLFGP